MEKLKNTLIVGKYKIKLELDWMSQQHNAVKVRSIENINII